MARSRLPGFGWSERICGGCGPCAELFEEAGHLDGIVAAGGHQARAERVGLAFGVAGKFQDEGIGAEAETHVREAGHGPFITDDSAGEHGGELNQVGLGGFVGSVTQDDVGHLVAHDAGELRFVVAGFEQAGVNEHRPAGQGECIDFGYIEDGEGELESALLRVRRVGQAGADAADVVLQELVLHDLILLQDLLGVGFAELDILLFGKEIEAGLQRVAGPAGCGRGRHGEPGWKGTRRELSAA